MGDITIVNQLLTGGYWRVLPDRPMAMLGELCQLRMHVDPWTAELWGSGNISGSWQKTLFLAYHLEVCMAQIYLHNIDMYIYIYSGILSVRAQAQPTAPGARNVRFGVELAQK